MIKKSFALNSLILKTSLEVEDLTLNLENRAQKEIKKIKISDLMTKMEKMGQYLK